MKKLLLIAAMLALAAPTWATTISPFNVRPGVAIGTSSDVPGGSYCAPVQAALGVADCELQTLLTYLDPGLNAVTDQNPAAVWQLASGAMLPLMKIEITANDATQELGIWSDADMVAETTADRTLVDIFLGGATGEHNGGMTVASLTFHLVGPHAGELEIYPGNSYSAGLVNTGFHSGINQYAFGFYLQPTGSGLTWYSADQLNGGLPQMMAYRNASANLWTIGFEDQAYGGPGDEDFNDLMFQIESIEPIPEPGSMLLLGSGLIGLAGAVRRRMKK